LRANKRNAKKESKRRERRNAKQKLDPFDDGEGWLTAAWVSGSGI